MKDYLRGYGLAQDLQVRDAATDPLACENPRRFSPQGPMADEWQAAVRWSPATSTPDRLEGGIGISAKNAQDLHNSAKAGDKKSKVLLQNLEVGLKQKKEGESGYGWRRDDDRFRMPEPPDGSLREATDYIYLEMMRNAASPELAEMRRLDQSEWKFNKGRGLHRFRNKVRGGGPWDHKNTLTTRQLNEGQVNGFRGNPSKWFYAPEQQSRYFFDVFSNIHYGYVGAAIGYNTDLLLDAAGAVQKRTSEGKARVDRFLGENREPEDLHTAYYKIDWGSRGWDDPMDQAAVQLGIHLYRKYGRKLTRKDLDRELSQWPGLNKKRNER